MSKFLILKDGDFHVNQLKGYGQDYCLHHPERPIYNLKIIHKCKSVDRSSNELFSLNIYISIWMLNFAVKLHVADCPKEITFMLV